MSHYRLIGSIVALTVSVAGPALVGQSQQPASPPAIGPFDSLHFRPLGPASMSGRISDLAVYEANPAIYYVGTGHGGVWKTINNGTTFEAQMQDHGLMSIGDIAVSQNNPDLGLGRDRRVEQPPKHLVGRRRLQIHRRGQNLRLHGTPHVALHQPHRH